MILVSSDPFQFHSLGLTSLCEAFTFTMFMFHIVVHDTPFSDEMQILCWAALGQDVDGTQNPVNLFMAKTSRL